MFLQLEWQGNRRGCLADYKIGRTPGHGPHGVPYVLGPHGGPYV